MSAGVVVEADELVKVYPGDVRAVDGVSFAVTAGEAFGLLGPNGAGKTTTIGMLTTAVTPTSGRARLAGHNVATDPIAARAVSSVVFQDPVIDRPLSGRQNLELHLRLWGVPRREGRARTDHLARTVGVSDILDRPMATYSGGQRRRVEIIRALISDPQVLFLDEPTVGLDTRVRYDLFDVIARLREETGVTVIMTTHYLDEAERLCDRLAIIDCGVLVACDTPARLLATMGPSVIELRVDEPDRAVELLRDFGVPAEDALVVGTTVTVAAHMIAPPDVTDLLDRHGVGVRASTVRPPTLDDVYLRLTGDRMTPTPH